MLFTIVPQISTIMQIVSTNMNEVSQRELISLFLQLGTTVSIMELVSEGSEEP